MAEGSTADSLASVPSGIAAELAAAGFENARQVARGGAGVIYRCYETALGRNVAVKVLPSHFDDDGRERFLREGYAMGGLSGHPNIVNILRVGVSPSGRPYIVMPYHAADSLAVRLRREGPVAWPEALRIGVKLCGALETAHKAGTLHRDIKPANILINDYGEPLLSDFGIAHIEGGYETATGYFSGTIDYTAPEVLTGTPATVASDVYSLGATIYALIAGNAAHERNTGEELLAQYMRISTTRVPDLRPDGIPDPVCSVIEKAMSVDPAERPVSAADFGRELQAAQRRNGLKPDSMAITGVGIDTDRTISVPADFSLPPCAPISAPRREVDPPAAPAAFHGPTAQVIEPRIADLGGAALSQPSEPGQPTAHGSVLPVGSKPLRARATAWFAAPGKKQNRIASVAAAAVVALTLVVSGVYHALPHRNDVHPSGASQPGTQWKPIASARVARDEVAATEADGIIWIFGGIRSDGAVTGQQEGYDADIRSWTDDDDLPVPVQNAMAVTWQGTPVVLGGWRTTSEKRDATDQVWRVINSHWVELPHMLQPRAEAAAAVVGNRIVVTGGVDAGGALLNTTEVFDGTSWTLGAPMLTPRTNLAAASDGKLLYAVGGSNGNTDLATVEAYDPAAKTWTTMAPLPEPRSDLGMAITDGRLVVVGGVSSGQVLKSVDAFDLMAKTWAGLPDMQTARHGMAVAAVEKSVYAIGGSTNAGDTQVTSAAEELALPPRRVQPAAHWHFLPEAPHPRLEMAWAVLDDKIWIMGGLRNGVALNTVERYDPQTGFWRAGPSLPIALHHAMAVTYRGEVVVIGGAIGSADDASNKVFALRDGGWVELPSLRHARLAAAAAVVGDKLVVVGGQNANQLVSQTEVFDGSSWKDAANLPTPREHLSAVSDGSYVYTIGGRFLSADRASAALERFDPKSGTWIKQLSMPTSDESFGAAFLDGRIVVVGGETPTQVLGVAEMYDIADGKWSTLPPLPTPRHGAVVAIVGDTVYCIDGANQPARQGALATIEALDFS